VSDLGIVIVNWNTRDRLRDCLASLDASRGVSFITYVIDNSSTDGSAEMVRHEFPHVRLIASPVNGGYSYANNLGLRQILALDPPPPFVLLLNPDTVVPPDALAQMIEFFHTHPDAGVAGPKLVMEDGKLDLACRRSFPSPELSIYHVLGLDKRFPHSRRFARYNLTYLDEDMLTEVDAVVGAFMMMRTLVLRQVGLLDEAYFMYGEDLDLSLRIKQRGWKIYYNPAVRVLHYKRQASKQSARARYEFWRAGYLFYKKHYAANTPLPLHLLVIAGLALKGGWQLVREMMQPLATSTNHTEIYPASGSGQVIG
jgi:GT2 family glycosyltransferase